MAVYIQYRVNRKSGMTWVKANRIAKDLDCSIRGVGYAGARLKKKGLLDIKHGSRGSGLANEYRPILKENAGSFFSREKGTAVPKKENAGS